MNERAFLLCLHGHTDRGMKPEAGNNAEVGSSRMKGRNGPAGKPLAPDSFRRTGTKINDEMHPQY